jgi:TPR repeat protein
MTDYKALDYKALDYKALDDNDNYKTINDELFKLAHKYHIGVGMPINLNKAHEIYDKLIKVNHIGCLYKMAYIYARGDGDSISKDVNKAIELYSKLVELKETDAIYYLGAEYEKRNRQNDIPKIVELYKKAHELGNTLALYHKIPKFDTYHGRTKTGMEILYFDHPYNLVIDAIARSAELGNDAAKYMYWYINYNSDYYRHSPRYGNIHNTLVKLWKNSDINLEFIKNTIKEYYRSMQLGDAQYNVIQQYSFNDKEFYGYSKAASNGNEYAYGLLLIGDRWLNRNLDYKIAIENKYTIALNIYAEHIAKTDIKKAIKIYNDSIELGSMFAMHKLLSIYESDIKYTKEKDILHTKMIEMKDILCLYKESTKYYDVGSRTKINSEKAFGIYKTIVNLDYNGDINNKEVIKYFGSDVIKTAYHNSLINLAYLYYNIYVDYDKYIETLNKGVDWKNDKLMYELSICYETGDKVVKDISKAVELCNNAADLKNAFALCKLADYYAEGKYVKKNTERTISLYNNAISLGNLEATTKLKQFYEKLDNY